MDSPHSAPSPQHPHASLPSLPPSSYPDSPLQHRQRPHRLLHFSSAHPPQHRLPLPPASSPFQSLYPPVYRSGRASIRLCSPLRCRRSLERGLFFCRRNLSAPAAFVFLLKIFRKSRT